MFVVFQGAQIAAAKVKASMSCLSEALDAMQSIEVSSSLRGLLVFAWPHPCKCCRWAFLWPYDSTGDALFQTDL